MAEQLRAAETSVMVAAIPEDPQRRMLSVTAAGDREIVVECMQAAMLCMSACSPPKPQKNLF